MDGYGFLRPCGSHTELFFHGGDVHGLSFYELRLGEYVRFDVVLGDRGLRAVRITVDR